MTAFENGAEWHPCPSVPHLFITSHQQVTYQRDLALTCYHPWPLSDNPRSTSQAFVCAFDEDADASTAACACAVDVAACAEELPESAGDAAERVAMAERRAEAADLSVRVLSRHVELLREQLSKEQTRSADFKLACKRTKQRCYRMISAGRTRWRAHPGAATKGPGMVAC